MIDHNKFRLSLIRLEEQHENLRRGNPALSDLDREGVAESVIQRFETCYDCLWKVLTRYLIEALGIADTPNSPKPIFRLAHENDLFAAPGGAMAALRRCAHRHVARLRRREGAGMSGAGSGLHR